MTSNEVRQQFLDFFKDRNHKIVPSAPVVPHGDPTLLFTNAGMNQFKDVFLGTGSRDYKRAADTQKCIRVSGKHNDLEEVGYDTYHHTFFEMLGNWSFGDYYKKEAIRWAWELLTEVWKLPKERLWGTVYSMDDEALNFWKSETDINPGHILKFGEKDNFWEMGDIGPCGPCSEIHINLGDDFNNPKYVNTGDPQCIEIWNLVFIQYNRDLNGTLTELPSKHIDTGMGFERVCAVLQNKISNYDTDVFTPIIHAIERLSGKSYTPLLSLNTTGLTDPDNIAMRVIADHIRTLTFAIGDGAAPGNDGRGYVLRRLLRRAARYGRKIDLKEPFLFKLVQVVVDNFSHVFPEIKSNQPNIEKIIKAEEESFNSTLDRGIEMFDALVKKQASESSKIISGDSVFKLYDTFGFPVDLTNVMAREQGLTIDETRFDELMNLQKERARKATKDKMASINEATENLDDFNLSSTDPTEFTGYDSLKTEAKIAGSRSGDKKLYLILDRTPFYVESGGQVGDAGSITIGNTTLPVIDLLRIKGQVIHILENGDDIQAVPGTAVIAEVDYEHRWNIMRNHSATHFLHKALRQMLGEHVHQSGSYVGPERLRFDFSHSGKVSDKEIEGIESLINQTLRKNLPLIHHRNIPFEQAKKMGALMFFGDKYGDRVNVVQFGDFTMEFCGGTHVKNSSEIGLFKIVGESSISSGIRRIEAVTGAGVEKLLGQLSESMRNQEMKINGFLEEKRKLEKELAGLRLKNKLSALDAIILTPLTAKGLNIFKGIVDADGMDELKLMGDDLREKIKSGVGVLISEFEGKVGIVAVVSDDLIKGKKISAGKIVGEIAKLVGGGGGGKAHLATAGGKDTAKIGEALEKIESIVAALF